MFKGVEGYKICPFHNTGKMYTKISETVVKALEKTRVAVLWSALFLMASFSTGFLVDEVFPSNLLQANHAGFSLFQQFK
jgi:hypothetical protein